MAEAGAGAQTPLRRRVTPPYWDQAARELADRDPVLGELIERFPGLTPRSRGNAFSTLARAIVGQQISVRAAESVWQRFVAVVGAVAPPAVVRRSHDELRAAGLSRQKITYLRDLAGHFLAGTVSVEHWSGLDDEALVAELTQVRGVGRWTAEMFLIFHLQRPNVPPLDDLGLRKAVSVHYNHGCTVSLHRLRALGGAWAPLAFGRDLVSLAEPGSDSCRILNTLAGKATVTRLPWPAVATRSRPPLAAHSPSQWGSRQLARPIAPIDFGWHRDC
jgi:DNA-3-methyladenine glycosylase II